MQAVQSCLKTFLGEITTIRYDVCYHSSHWKAATAPRLPGVERLHAKLARQRKGWSTGLHPLVVPHRQGRGDVVGRAGPGRPQPAPSG